MNKTFLFYFMAIFMIASILYFDIKDHDIWWHLQVGKDILVHQIWPSPDIYSFTTNQHWTVHSWLIDCIFYAFFITGDTLGFEGIDVLFVLRLILLTLFLSWLLYYCYRKTKSFPLSLLLVLFITHLCHIIPIRPIIINPILMSIFFVHFLRKSASLLDYLVYIPLKLFWVNSQGSFIIFDFVLFITLLVNIINTKITGQKWFDRRWIILSFLLLSCSLINIDPISLFQRIFEASRYPTADWNTIFWWCYNAPFQGVPILITELIVISFWIWTLTRLKNYRASFLSGRLVFGLLSIILAFCFFRFSWLLVILAMDSAINIQNSKPVSFLNDFRIVYVFYIVLLLSIPPQPNDNKLLLPDEALDFIHKEQITGNIASQWTWGGFITFSTDKKCQTFIDTRIEPFTEDIIKTHHAYVSSPINSFLQVKKSGANYILLPVDDSIEQWNTLNQEDLIDFIFIGDQCFLAKINNNESEVSSHGK